MSKIMDRPPEEICRKARIPLLLASSMKAGFELDWSDPKQKALAIQGRRQCNDPGIPRLCRGGSQWHGPAHSMRRYDNEH
ncbi:hypothetical protein WMF18_14745 [Sorangium sp. So ce315]|uniref:hypothetical protein n=1 Tax=Sorangium sp. So ce315 TaxID=3133299 RepID=UPI003F5F63B9